MLLSIVLIAQLGSVLGDIDSVIVDGGIPEPLITRPGDPLAGRAAFVDRDGAHCLLCHRVTQLDAPFQGTLGPDLSRYGDTMDIARARLQLVDATRLNPNTVMPAYYRTRGLRQVAKAYRGQPVLTAQQIEDILAFLATLTAQEDSPDD